MAHIHSNFQLLLSLHRLMGKKLHIDSSFFFFFLEHSTGVWDFSLALQSKMFPTPTHLGYCATSSNFSELKCRPQTTFLLTYWFFGIFAT